MSLTVIREKSKRTKIGMSSNLFQTTQKILQKRVDLKLHNLFQMLAVPSERLKNAMGYAVLSQGKRLRPLLIYLTAKTLNVPFEKLDNIACAVECMHAYSLVHDDLPAMDNDDLRRGKPTCHRAFDEATAILAGDALQALAFQQIFLIDSQLLTPTQKNEAALLLSLSCGAQGMISGQAMDLEYLSQTLSADLLQQIHQLKTGIFLETCVDLAILTQSEINEIQKQSLRSFAKHLGLAFQIQDDYLDAYGETETLGKSAGSDERQGKKTYVSLYSKEDLFGLWQNLYQEAMMALEPLREAATDLKQLIEYLSKRTG